MSENKFFPFFEFLDKKEILGVIISTTIALNTKELVDSFIKNIINPLIHIDRDNDGMADETFHKNLDNLFNLKIDLGKFILKLIQYILVIIIIYFIFNLINYFSYSKLSFNHIGIIIFVIYIILNFLINLRGNNIKNNAYNYNVNSNSNSYIDNNNDNDNNIYYL